VSTSTSLYSSRMFEATAKVAMLSNMPRGWHLSKSSYGGPRKDKIRGRTAWLYMDSRLQCHDQISHWSCCLIHLDVPLVQGAGDDKHDVVDHMPIRAIVHELSQRFAGLEGECSLDVADYSQHRLYYKRPSQCISHSRWLAS